MLQFPNVPQHVNPLESMREILENSGIQEQNAAQRLANARAQMQNQQQQQVMPSSIGAQIAQNQAARQIAPLDVASKRAALTTAQYSAAHPLLALSKDFGSSPVGQVLLAHTLPSAIASLDASRQAPQPAAVDSVGPLASGYAVPGASSPNKLQDDISQQMLNQIKVAQNQKAASAAKNTAQSRRGWLPQSVNALAIMQQIKKGNPLGSQLGYSAPAAPATGAPTVGAPATSGSIAGALGASATGTVAPQTATSALTSDDNDAIDALQNVIDKATHTNQQTQGMVTAMKALTALKKAKNQVMLAHKYFSPMGQALYHFDQIKNPNDPAVLAYKMYNSDMASAKGDIAASMGIKGTDMANKEFQPLFDINNWRTDPKATQKLFNNMVKNIEDETKTNVGTISENKNALASAKFPYVSDSDVEAVSPGLKPVSKQKTATDPYADIRKKYGLT